jgi:hypothetical protein
METISTALRQVNRELRTMQRESVNSLRKTDKRRLQTIEDFGRAYNPDYLITRCKGMTIEDINTLCLFAETPTLSEIRATYGKNAPIVWLMAQLNSLSEFCGAKEKMDVKTAERTAFIICTNYYYLKASELLLFFYKFSTGRYGRFYGTTDPQIILQALSTFVHTERDPVPGTCPV